MSKMTRNIQCDRKMVQCDMNVPNEVFKLAQMFRMTRPKCHKIVIKDTFSTSVWSFREYIVHYCLRVLSCNLYSFVASSDSKIDII